MTSEEEEFDPQISQISQIEEKICEICEICGSSSLHL
jgi:hypothetical protein